MRCNMLWLGLTVAVACAVAVGCTQAPSGNPKSPSAAPKDKDKVEPVAHKHDHNAPGKHGGQQQLLGNHEYHAELADNDETGEVAVYITDAELNPVAVPEKELFLTASIEGQPKEFTLKGDANLSEGQPRFVLVDKQLCDAVCKGKDGVRLNATIKGKPYAATYTTSGHADHVHGEMDADKHDEHPGEKQADEHSKDKHDHEKKDEHK
jgi:hypothetical protein